MAKRKNNSLVSQLGLIALLAAVLATVLLFFEGFGIKVLDEVVKLDTLKVVFGGDGYKFNFLLLVTILLPVAGGIVQLLVDNKFGSLIGIVLVVVGIVMMFNAKASVDLRIIVANPKLVLTATGYISMILSIVSVGTMGYKLSKQL
ncbi:MAG TPA: hypothetical protein VJ845_03185 [Haploplasma sp.]|nr:hypothetical protein [Haploplasma sp.]